jgi:hypothetical protein
VAENLHLFANFVTLFTVGWKRLLYYFIYNDSDRVFREKGAAFPFVRRFLSINEHFKKEQPVEVVLLSRNSAVTGNRRATTWLT